MKAEYVEKTAARKLSEVSGVSYQTALHAVRDRNVALLPGLDVPQAELLATYLTVAHDSDLDGILEELLRTALLHRVRLVLPDAATVTVGEDYDPAEGEHYGFVGAVLDTDGNELPLTALDAVGGRVPEHYRVEVDALAFEYRKRCGTPYDDEDVLHA